MHFTVELASRLGGLAADLLPNRPLVHKPKHLPICTECAGWLDTGELSPSFLPTLIQELVEKGFENGERDDLERRVRILPCVFAVPVRELD